MTKMLGCCPGISKHSFAEQSLQHMYTYDETKCSRNFRKIGIFWKSVRFFTWHFVKTVDGNISNVFAKMQTEHFC